MSTADKIESIVLKIAGIGVAFFGLRALNVAVKRKATEDYYAEKHKDEGANGIGAAERIKRRIYKEISLAQNAGIDFNKDYSEFTDEEIATLEELGHNASWEQKEQKPYAQAYYESLSKAYNAISGVGIGSAYDILDKDGNVILTWIEDAAAHVAHEREIEEARKRTLEAEERAAAARKKKNSTQRKLQQMSLFGTGYAGDPTYTQKQLDRYVNSNRLTDVQVDLSDNSKPGKYYVLCGDDQGGRGFYLAKSNVHLLYNYCRILGIPFDWCNADIAGVNYAPEVEHELWEIWREQLENEETNWDYDVWRAKVGDDYARAYVLPYM